MAELARLAGDLLGVGLSRGRRRPRSSPSRRCRTSPRARGRARRLRIPSDSPVSIDSSRVSPREAITGPSATSWSPGSIRITSPGTTSSARRSIGDAVADRLRPRRDQQRELVERLLGVQLLADADVGVDGGDQRRRSRRRTGPSERIRMKKTPMTALNRVKTFADDDARDRAAVRRLGFAEPREAAWRPRRWSIRADVPARSPCRSSVATGRLPAPAANRCVPGDAELYDRRRVAAGGDNGERQDRRRRFPVSYRGRPRSIPAHARPRSTASTLEVAAGEICVFVGPSGLRQDDRDADGQPDGRDLRGRHPRRRPLRPRPLAGRAAARHRLRDPADRPLPPPHDRREHRHRARPARLGQGADPGIGSTS